MLAVLVLLTSSAPCVSSAGPGCVVDAELGGSRVRLQVDTGADVTMISSEAAKRIGLRWDRQAPLIRMRGIAGETWAVLVRTSIQLGPDKEEGVTVAVAPLSLGRAEGLLGMTFLERFRSSMGGGELHLQAIDETDKPRPGGHGRTWWVMRFRQSQARLQQYQQVLGSAKESDRKLEAEIGVDPAGMNQEEMVGRLKKFVESDLEELSTLAARGSVPLDWRR